jgi:molybdopterin-guanine dinucleotide biosynthesis protein A
MWTAAILAGGKGRRYGGRDKSRLVLDGQSVRDRQLAAVGALGVPILIVGAEHPATIPPGTTTVMDLESGCGPMGGLWTALALAPTERVLAIAADMPFVAATFLAWLTRQGEAADIAVPRTRRGLEPLCATYSRACAPVLRACLDRGRLSLHEFIASSRDALQVVVIDESTLSPFDPDGRLFLNINTPADYARALELLDDGRGGKQSRSAPHTAVC